MLFNGLRLKKKYIYGSVELKVMIATQNKVTTCVLELLGAVIYTQHLKRLAILLTQKDDSLALICVITVVNVPIVCSS